MTERRESVIVTGSAGFIGRNMCAHFAALGYAVFGIDPFEEEQARDGMVRVRAAVTLDAIAALSVQFPVRYVIHCAGSGSVAHTEQYPYDDLQSNILTLGAVLEWLRIHCPEAVLLFPSSAAVYGSVTAPSRETDELRPLSMYAGQKILAEGLIRSYSAAYGITAGIFRLYSVYGEGLRKQLLWDACRKAAGYAENRFFGTGDEIRDFVHIDDIVRLFSAIGARIPGNSVVTINGASGAAGTIREVIAALFGLFGADADPRFSGEVRREDPAAMIADTAEALRCGWTPTVSLQEGLSRYGKWFRAEEMC